MTNISTAAQVMTVYRTIAFLLALALGVPTLSAQERGGIENPCVELTTTKSDPITVKLSSFQEDTQIILHRGSWSHTVTVGKKATAYVIEGESPKIEIMGPISTLTCSSSGITGCFATKAHPLVKLVLSRNEISSFSAISFPELTALSLQGCGLEQIDLSVGGTKLTNINLNDNKLQSLDLSACPLLTRVQFANNSLDACTLNDIYATLPMLAIPASKANLINAKSNDTNEAATSSTNIATAKNWRVQTPGDGSGCLPPQISIESSKRTEQIFYLRVAENGPISFDIDWGDGVLQHYEMIQEASGARLEVKGTPISNTITFFGNWTYFEANEAGITSINTSHAPNLTSLYLRRNELSEVDLSKNGKLKKLYLRANQLSEINLESTPLLEELYIRDNLIKSIDLSVVPNLRELALSYNPIEVPLDLTHTSKLVKLYLGGIGLEQIDLSSCPELYQFEAERNRLQQLDISQCGKIGIIKIAENNFDAVSLSKLYLSLPKPQRYIDWVNLTIEGNPGATASYTDIAIAHGWKVDVEGDASGAQDLPPHVLLDTKKGYYDKIKLSASSSQPLEIWGATQIEGNEYQLYASKVLIVGTIEKLNVSNIGLVKLSTLQAPLIKELDCSENDLTELDVTPFEDLKTLLCYRNKLTKLTLTGCHTLELLNCTDNLLTEIDLSDMLSLKILFCTFNRLTQLSTEGLNSLTLLDCGSNRIKKLDLSSAPTVRELDCSNNKVLDELTLAGCRALASLDCSGNALSSLFLEDLGLLQQLRCYNNRLTKLDLSSHPQLYAVALDCNQINVKEMDELIQSLPLKNAKQHPSAEIRVMDLKNPKEANVCSSQSVEKAQRKNWSVLAFNGEKDVPYEGSPAGISIVQEKRTNSPLFYPTITRGVVYISEDAQQVLATKSLVIYDMEGERILQIVPTEGCKEIDLSNLPRGAYLFALESCPTITIKLY